MAALLETRSPVAERSLAVLATATALAFAWFARGLLVPALLGIFAALAVNPIVSRLERRVPRSVAAIAGTLTATVVVGVLASVLWLQLLEFLQDWPAYQERLREVSAAIAHRFGRIRTQSEALVPAPPRGTVRVTEGVPWGTLLVGTAQGAAALVTSAIVAVFTLYFALADGPRYRVKLLGALRTPEAREHARAALDEIHRDVGQYLVNRVALNTGFGVAVGVAFALYGLQHAAIWGLTTAVARFVPFVGTAIGFTLPVAMAVLQYGNLGDPALVAAIYLVLAAIQGNVVDPILLGRQLRMNTLAVFLGSLFWYWIWGPAGLLLAVPLLSSIRVVCRHVPRLRVIATLLGE